MQHILLTAGRAERDAATHRATPWRLGGRQPTQAACRSSGVESGSIFFHARRSCTARNEGPPQLRFQNCHWLDPVTTLGHLLLVRLTGSVIASPFPAISTVCENLRPDSESHGAGESIGALGEARPGEGRALGSINVIRVACSLPTFQSPDDKHFVAVSFSCDCDKSRSSRPQDIARSRASSCRTRATSATKTGTRVPQDARPGLAPVPQGGG